MDLWALILLHSYNLCSSASPSHPLLSLSKDIYDSFIYNSPKLETMQMLTSKRMDRQSAVYPHSEILLRNNNE